MFRIQQKLKLSGYNSLFLDSLRILAALAVVYVHASDQWATYSIMPFGGGANIGHLGVVIFFVLSGYVIIFSTSAKGKGPLVYGISRLSRLYSMVVPALIISAIIQFLVSRIDANLILEYTRGASWPRYLLSSLFLSESGLISAAPPINRPLWSLSYEFWYYVIFGLFFFKNGNWKSYLFIAVACFIAGPKILLMMPIWIFGCLAYKINYAINPKYKSWTITFVLLILGITAYIFIPAIPFELGIPPFYYSNQFLTDYAIGLFFAAALCVMPVNASSSHVSKWAKKFRKIGDLTFPIYVLHHPLLILWKSIIGFRPNDEVGMWIAFVVVIFVSSIIGILLERQRFIWDNFFRWLMNLPFLKLTIYPRLNRMIFQQKPHLE